MNGNLMVVIPIPGFTDPFSAMTHLAGAGVFMAWAVLLVMRGRGGPGLLGGGAPPHIGRGREAIYRMVALGVFGFAAVAQLGVSGAFHILSRDHLPRLVMQRIDHAIIFFLITATFVPLHTILFRGWRRWGILGVMFTLAAAGIVMTVIFFMDIPEWLSQSVYVSMGWVGAYSGKMLYDRYGWALIRPLYWGGICYTIGAVVDFAKWPEIIPGVVESHELFHIAVLAGLAFHFRFTWTFAKGPPDTFFSPDL